MMKRIWLMLGIVFFMALGCDREKIQGLIALGAQSNNAGTLSVQLPAGVVENVPEDEGAAEVRGGAEAETGGSVIEIKEKMFIAQTNDVYVNPDEYLGKTIKLEGLFRSLTYEDTGTTYHFVLRLGPGCCGYDGNAGFEVSWEPLDVLSGMAARAQQKPPLLLRTHAYPNEDDWVEAIGTLKAYEEDGYPYLYIDLTSLTILEERGAEFVTH
jgi:hypothetical protein